ncbi:hypothetical protein GIB67_033607 [Kingdonia uniflora]|uniref:Disease resistance N-terminal domain-containing protein n=1 Tax=Kingdonia uniflora TaxID=39325 RepID=A0A7J7LAG9_9MAGN|nr:hypothetical protein GIB67_033607 [Kingdonia uniflora]
MADALISAVVELLAPFLLDKLKKEVKLVLGAPEDVQELHDTFDKIRDALDDAEKRHVKNVLLNLKKNEIKVPESAWLEKLKDVSYEMEDVLDEWHTKILKLEIAADESSAPDGAGKKKGRLDLLITEKEKFPNDMGKMVSLRHLEFLGSSLECFPRGIGKLRDLETLNEFVVSEEGADIEELKDLNNLRDSVSAIMGLQVLYGDSVEDISAPVIAFPNLKKLSIGEMKHWEEWVITTTTNITVMPFLQTLSIEDCPLLKSLPCQILSFSLREIRIEDCPHLEISCLPPFLEKLNLKQDAGSLSISLPIQNGLHSNLKSLVIEDSPHSTFPQGLSQLKALQTLKVSLCDSLTLNISEFHYEKIIKDWAVMTSMSLAAFGNFKVWLALDMIKRELGIHLRSGSGPLVKGVVKRTLLPSTTETSGSSTCTKRYGLFFREETMFVPRMLIRKETDTCPHPNQEYEFFLMFRLEVCTPVPGFYFNFRLGRYVPARKWKSKVERIEIGRLFPRRKSSDITKASCFNGEPAKSGQLEYKIMEG